MGSKALDALSGKLTKTQAKQLKALDTPMAIQQFLDDTPYSTELVYRSPLTVLRDRKAHCFDGACFAAMALMRLGQRPMILDMLPWDDDDHVLSVFRRGRCYGAIAKSNFVMLRYREPVFRDLRELLMSYFEPFHNVAGARTLRGYTELLDLRRFDKLDWTTNDAAMDAIADGLDHIPRVRLFTPAQIRAFTKVDRWIYDANLMRADPKGLFAPKEG